MTRWLPTLYAQPHTICDEDDCEGVVIGVEWFGLRVEFGYAIRQRPRAGADAPGGLDGDERAAIEEALASMRLAQQIIDKHQDEVRSRAGLLGSIGRSNPQ